MFGEVNDVLHDIIDIHSKRLVQSTKHDPLEFWSSRDPRAEVADDVSNGRRFEGNRYRNRIHSNEKTTREHHEPKFAEIDSHAQKNHITKDPHYVRHRPNTTSKAALRSDRHKVIDSKERTKKALRTINSKIDAPVTPKEPSQPGHEDDRWPRVHRHKKIQAIKSTRLTPAYLMQQRPDETTKKTTTTDDHPTYLYPHSIKRDIQDFIALFPFVNVTTEIIGRTVEYNDIVLLKMTEFKGDRYFRADNDKYMDEVPEKKIIFIVHGLSVMGMYQLNCMHYYEHFKELLTYYVDHLDKFDIFLMPMANPDGFEASKYLWNKNMSPQNACPGVAVDRNFDIAWNLSREVSSCSHMFPGISPFSEAESRAVRDTFHRYSHKIVGYFHVHAGTFNKETFKGDAVLFPKGYTDIQSDDDKYIDLKGEIDEALKNASYQVMSVTVDTLHNWYGRISGASVDYAATVYGIPYAMELVMQLYDSEPWQQHATDYVALVDLWNRVIHVIFSNIWRNTHETNA